MIEAGLPRVVQHRERRGDDEKVQRLDDAQQRQLAGMDDDPADEDGGDAGVHQPESEPHPLEEQPVGVLVRFVRQVVAQHRLPGAGCATRDC